MKKQSGILEIIKTEHQWLLDGYVLKKNAKATSVWDGHRHIDYYPRSSVKENTEKASAMIREERHKAYLKSKELSCRRKEFEEIYKDTHTLYQWLFEYGRIPMSEANWRRGEDLNRYYKVLAFGSDYYYCHIRDTYEPTPEQLSEARQNYKPYMNR